MSNREILRWLASMAHQPAIVYSGVAVLLIASSFGLPVPEELTLLSAGFIAHAARKRAITALNAYVLAGVCFLSVLASDLIVFTLGRKLGERLKTHKRFGPLMSGPRGEKIQRWTREHAFWACAGFRFTPGLRFPGHLACGAVGISQLMFITIDGTAALLTVPTQVLAVAFYGDTILTYLRQAKVTLLSIGGALLVVYILFRLFNKRRWRAAPKG